MAAAGPRRRKIIGQRRRVEDDGEDDAGLEAHDLDDDSLTDGSIGSDDNDQADDSDTSNIDEGSPTSPNARKSAGNGTTKPGLQHKLRTNGEQGASSAPKFGASGVTDTDVMLNGLSLGESNGAVQEINFEELEPAAKQPSSAPVVVSSVPTPDLQNSFQDRRRREHEEYRRKRDEDPAFVPNRGAFFMHDHRHAGPSANGFRPFGRGLRGGGGRGRGNYPGLYHPVNFVQNRTVDDPLTNSPWTHDMHEAVAEPIPSRPARHTVNNPEGPPNGNGLIRTAAQSDAPINRAMSTEKVLGNVIVRVMIPPMKAPKSFPGVTIKQYTKLPDHRPPLRRDKPVRVSLPYHQSPIMPRYIFPAHDRSFIFIPRALRPNSQQRVRGKGPRSTLGSVGGFSRRTSVFGGSYYGSTYSPSIALSRRSSIAPEFNRDFLISPTGSAISRPPIPMESARPTVRLPPMPQPPHASQHGIPPPNAAYGTTTGKGPWFSAESSLQDLPPPQTHPLPQKPMFQENRPNSIPMHQPRPQKTVSVENLNIENSPHESLGSQQYQTAFQNQVPPQVANGFKQEPHSRRPSYPTHVSTGTPLSQIPERAIHAAPFQPNTYAQAQPQAQPQPQQAQAGYYGQAYPMMQPQQGYYYPPNYGPGMAPAPAMAPMAGAPAFVPGTQEGQQAPFGHPATAPETSAAPPSGAAAATRLISQNIGGTMYYFDPSQIPAMATYPSYPNAQPYVVPGHGMGGVVTPTPEAMYYQQPAPGMVGATDYSQFNYQPPVPGMANFSQ